MHVRSGLIYFHVSLTSRATYTAFLWAVRNILYAKILTHQYCYLALLRYTPHCQRNNTYHSLLLFTTPARCACFDTNHLTSRTWILSDPPTSEYQGGGSGKVPAPCAVWNMALWDSMPPPSLNQSPNNPIIPGLWPEPPGQRWPLYCPPPAPPYSPNVGLLLAHRLRRWPNNNPTLGECLVFAGHPPNTPTRCRFHDESRVRMAVWRYPANTKHWTNVRLLLGRRRRRWPNINPTLGQCLVFP